MGISTEDIVYYYDTLELDYRFMWNLGRNVAMHFGYWDEQVRTFPEALERENAVLAERVGVGRGEQVLDAGCGIGGSAIYLAREHGCHVTGITLSARQVRTAQRLARRAGVADRTRFEWRDFCATGYPAGNFQVVWALESACHAADKGGWAREMHRLLVPGGRLVVADGFVARPARNPREQALMQGWLRGWCVEALATVEGFVRGLEEAGFVDARVSDVSAHVLPSSRRLYRWSRPLLGLAALLARGGRSLRTRALNLRAAHGQYLALTAGLWCYGIVSARKP